MARLALGLVLAASAVGVGRYERAAHVERELEEMRGIAADVGPLDNPNLSTVRFSPEFTCLLYWVGAHPFALELCFDRDGRLVEALDRRAGELEVATLRFEPAASTIRVDPAIVHRLGREVERRRKLQQEQDE